MELFFPAAGELRQYALKTAPLRRVRFKEGDSIKTHQGDSHVVDHVDEQSGLITYLCGKIKIVESELADTISFSKPEDRLLAGQADELRVFDLRIEALQRRAAMQQSPVRGFVGGRVDLLPHQMYIANEDSSRLLPRVLLADEVGLGKTIEVLALLLHRQQRNPQVGAPTLLICPTYCRFCFRREHVGPDGGLLTEAELSAAYAWLSTHPEITEVILTGGDPLMLSSRRLSSILNRLSAISHIETLRIHSRVPVAEPSRLNEELADAMATETPLWLVVHANHASEFTEAARAALRRVQSRAIPVLGQSVLLRDVNDSSQALESLFRAMLAARVKPYYLHQLDPAPGTARFHVPIEEGRRLLADLRGRVTGLAWPTYVLDIPGGAGKVPIGPDYLEPDGEVRSPSGSRHKLAASGGSV